jgi:hypothetical protein
MQERVYASRTHAVKMANCAYKICSLKRLAPPALHNTPAGIPPRGVIVAPGAAWAASEALYSTAA